MPFQPVPNAASAVIHFTGNGRPSANVLHFQFATAYTITDIITLASLVDTAVGTFYLPLLPTAMNYVSTIVTGLTTANDLQATVSTNAGTGTLTTPPLPANSSMCVTLRTGFTGRSARGRFYTMPTTQANQLSSTAFTTAYATACAALVSHIQTAAASGSWTMVVVSRFHNGVARPTGLVFPVLTAEARNNDIDSQRNRLAPNH